MSECGKRVHTEELSAIGAAIRLSRQNVPLRVYWCTKCKGYHLTKRRLWGPAR